MKPTVAIIGVGLIGGSLGQALRRSGKYRVLGISRHALKLRTAKRLGAIDRGSIRLKDAASADILVFASPIDSLFPQLKHILPFLKPDTVISDVGSVKGTIMRGVARLRLPAGVRFVGGHPLAGSHKTGVQAADPRLFEGSTVVLVPGSKAGVGPLKSLWRAAGAKCVIMSAEEHDRAVALISHLPHVIAHALVRALAGRPERKRLLPLLAGSFRDATRVASADADQWAQILRANAPAVSGAVKEFQKHLNRIEQTLPRPRLKADLQKSRRFRLPLFNGA